MIFENRRRAPALLSMTLLACGSVLAGGAEFPVKYSVNQRYLADSGGAPFPILGRTAWFVMSLGTNDYRTFIDDTVSRGYNSIEFHVINHDPRGNNEPFNGNGELPFTKRLDGRAWDGRLQGLAPDFTTPNEGYWRFVDGFLSYCESKGVLAFMFPAYVGYAGGEQGWMGEMAANGKEKMERYGAWIASRYRKQKNLVWMMGGDMGSFSSGQLAAEEGLLNGLRSVSGQESTNFSAEWHSGEIATDQSTFGAFMTLNGAYDWRGNVNKQGRRAYSYAERVMPAFLLEEPYDEEGPDGNKVNPSATQPVRRFQWWGWLSTIGGYIAGNGYIWPFNPGWKGHLDTQGARDMGRLNDFIRSIQWWTLVPSGLDGMKTLITARGGFWVSSSDYVAAAASRDGKLLVAYVPPAHSGYFTVDMTAMSGPSRARWFDPSAGTYATSSGSPYANSGPQSFTPPGQNAAGENDWVLVLDIPGAGGMWRGN